MALADTQSVVWLLCDRAKLSPAAESALQAAVAGGAVSISVITLVELVYLEGKKTFPYTGVLHALYALAADPHAWLRVLPLTIDIARAMDRVPRDEVSDMPDRIVAATAIAHGLSLVTSDTDIRGSASLNALVPVIW